jgi:hypothetical protein
MEDMKVVPVKALFTSLFAFSAAWCRSLNGGQAPQEKVWKLPRGNLKALLWNTSLFPKTGLSYFEKEKTYRVGLNLYVRNPMIPDGSFALLLAQQDDVGFIGGVLELFPTVRIEEDIAGFRDGLNSIAQKHMMDSVHLREGLKGAFTVGGEGEQLGAEAGFNFYRAGLEVTPGNLIFARAAFERALAEYNVIVEKRKDEVMRSRGRTKEDSWEKHLYYMKEEDIGIKMALEEGLPLDFFSFSTFPPEPR